jgi:NAD(P)-dependent dehydrogenase (short-subunit alcohol dehydrogenase family)
MNDPATKVVLITGASSGLGKATADYLKARGYCVYGTSRSPTPDPNTGAA